MVSALAFVAWPMASCREREFTIRRIDLRYAERPTKIRYSEYSMAKGQSLWNAFNIVIDILLRRLIK